MPYAFTEYSQLLYAQQRYAEWIEIHSLVGFSISELEKDLIKQIAKEEPEALIPSYHREISLLLDQKNRSAYRESVKMLKKLRTLYHKTKNRDLGKVCKAAARFNKTAACVPRGNEERKID